jgi:hypothetical protein
MQRCCLLRLRVGEGPLLGKALGFVQSGGLGGGAPGLGRRSLLRARTSALEVDLLPESGKVITKRADFLIGGAGRGACALWHPSLVEPSVL